MHIDLGDIWKQEREIDRRPETRDLLVSYKKKRKNEINIAMDMSDTIGKNSRLACRVEPLDQYEGEKWMPTTEMGHAECIDKVHHCLSSNEWDNAKFYCINRLNLTKILIM